MTLSNQERMNGKQVKRVLYVEDEKALTDSFEEFVREEQDGLSGRWQVKLEIARCIEDADGVLDTNEFDGLILDLMLPRLRDDLVPLADLNQRRLELVGRFFKLSNRRPGQAGAGDTQADQLEQEMTEVRAKIVELRSRLEPFKKFVRMLRTHLDGILSWTKHRVSNGAVEGMNNKIKSISHRSFGFRSAENFIAAIYHCCARLPLPLER